MYLNARSVKTVNTTINKLAEFNNLVYANDCQIVGVTETWLKSSVLSSEILDDNFIVYRRDRSDKRGGGVLLCVKRNIHSSHILAAKEAEILAIEVRPSTNIKFAFIICYRSPSTPVNEFVKELHIVLLKITKEYNRVCMMGDFNFPGIQWQDYIGQGTTHDEDVFLDFLSEFSLFQINSVPSTRHGNILDLIFTTCPTTLAKVEKIPSEFRSDHVPLFFVVNVAIGKPKIKTRYMYNFRKADIAQLRSELNKCNMSECVENSNTIEAAWTVLYNAINNVVSTCVPRVKISKRSGPPWFNKTVRHLIKCKNTAWRAFKRRKSKATRAKFNKLRNKLQRAIKTAYNDYLINLGTQVKQNPKTFWTFVKFKSKRASIPNVVTNEFGTFIDDFEKSEAFNAYFQSVFSKPDQFTRYTINENDIFVMQELRSITLSVNEVLHVIKNLDCNKSMSPDNISPYLLKHCSEE
jgi:hypothetical protein